MQVFFLQWSATDCQAQHKTKGVRSIPEWSFCQRSSSIWQQNPEITPPRRRRRINQRRPARLITGGALKSCRLRKYAEQKVANSDAAAMDHCAYYSSPLASCASLQITGVVL